MDTTDTTDTTNTMNANNEYSVENTNSIEIVDSFDDMGLKENLLRGIYSHGFEKPSMIQSKAVVPISSGRDVLAQSQSGTGKTGAFVIGALQRIDDTKDGCQAMVVTPTRELAEQILDVCTSISQYVNVKPVLCVGGSNIYDAKKSIESGCTVVIGTPGRIIDMIERRFLSTENIKLMIMDEADEMLSNSFLQQIKIIIQNIPTTSQICLFSATLPVEVVDLTKKFMDNPQHILVKKEQLTLEGIKQFYIDVDNEKWKLDTFCDLYNIMSISQSMIYVNTKRKAESLQNLLKDRNFTVSVIHSNMSHSERSAIMKEFRNGGTRILISTDLLSRGIDIQQVSIVINYDLPNNKECYIHRIGRSGRFGRKGVAINFATSRDTWKLDELQEFYQTKIEPMPSNIAELI
jgi:translation initiation factor 4A